jgi:hypothetical protein
LRAGGPVDQAGQLFQRPDGTALAGGLAEAAHGFDLGPVDPAVLVATPA